MLANILLLATVMVDPAPRIEPVTCIRTSISASGRAARAQVVVSSGSKAHDRGALQFLRALDFARMPMGLELGQSGHVLVRGTGPDTYTVDVTDPRLLESCPAAQAAGA